MKAIILAAGKGTRLYPLTLNKPKGLLELGNETILDRLICQFKSLGIKDILMVVGYQKESLIKHFGSSVRFIYYKDFAKTNNLHTLWSIRDELNDNIIISFADLVVDKQIKLCGNLKFDQDIPEELESISGSIRDSWSIEGKRRPTLIAASTHEGEEIIVLDSFNLILKKITDALLILVPRHLERFDRVESLIDNQGFNCSSRSKKEDVTNDVQVLLGDTMGELNFLYSVSDVAFVGGSLIDHGGQNLLEPAAQGLPLCSGPSLRNFVEISEQLKKSSGLKIINNKQELADYFIGLVNDENNLKETGQVSKAIFMKNRGAIEIINGTLKNSFKGLL